ncbi:sigma 54-interacting transcriptional regulator [Pseudenhygromyxa sp. WMMC2535]|uniref:helix-turn-helix domain-containing protein n=1 Tax=Pseudenhygromyxa sp. WMMC2535 TaxID=2712867 RepID=UPI0015575D37|nr:helix-turn-helix domain-containing protein [Pseudenhygromyxa sp. WMMC2535]NVB41853.1 sigma 54-interacting transcriptional regulator [Pseudenhygromyxa sp. WMMC2535]
MSIELAQIEFESTAFQPVRGEPSNEAAKDWFTGRSAAIDRLRARATRLGHEGAAVALIHGETGTGRLRLARWMHECGARSGRPLLVLDALDARVGAQLEVVRAALREREPRATIPGTIVLRHAERADAATLEVLTELLAAQGIELVCALILISRRTPEELRGSSPGHAKLLGRAASATLQVPPLRVRGDDIAALAREFAAEASRRYDKGIRGLSSQALSKLEEHDFPGNVRELGLLVEQAVLRASGDWVTAADFPSLHSASPISEARKGELVVRLPGSSLREIEIEALRMALALSEGRVVRAAELLGITRHALRRKLEKFGLTDLRAS